MYHKSAQEALLEVKHFLCILYGTLIRFYQTIVKHNVLDLMKEDLIDLITKLVFTHEHMTNILVGLCRVCTKDEERQFVLKLAELQEVSTSSVGLTKWFTLDESSEIRTRFQEQYGDQLNAGGDIGGSDMIIMPKSPVNEVMIVGSTQSQQLMVAEVEEVKLEE